MNAKQMIEVLSVKISPPTKAAMEKALTIKHLEISLEIEKLKLKSLLITEIATEIEQKLSEVEKDCQEK